MEGRTRGEKGCSIAFCRMTVRQRSVHCDRSEKWRTRCRKRREAFFRQSSDGLVGGSAPDRASLAVVEIGAFRKNVAVLRSGFCDFNVLTG